MNITLVDYNGLWWRCWHANGDSPVSEASAQVQRLVAAREAESDRIAICVDSHPTWRDKVYGGYKATREKHDEQALEQMRRCLEALRDDGYAIIRRDNQEADDIMGSLAAKLGIEHEVLIYSADKDMLQCLGPRVRRLSPAKPEVGEVGPDELMVTLGIHPHQVPTWLALVGDRADSIRGVDRCGPKTASKLLAEHRDIAGIIGAASAGKLAPALSRAITEATERSDCPLSVALRLAKLDLGAATDDDMRAVLARREPPPMDDEPDDAPAPAETIPDAPPSAVEAEVVVDAESPIPPPSAPRAIAPRAPDWESCLEPSNLTEAKQLAKYAFDSRLFGAYGTPQAALMTIIAGRELGMPAMASLRAFHIIEGRPTLSAQAMMAIALGHPAVKQFEVVESTDTRCIIRVHRNGWTEAHDVTWTTEDAQRAGAIGKKNWQRYPRQMLRARAIADAARLVCPERLACMYDPEELQS